LRIQMEMNRTEVKRLETASAALRRPIVEEELPLFAHRQKLVVTFQPIDSAGYVPKGNRIHRNRSVSVEFYEQATIHELGGLIEEINSEVLDLRAVQATLSNRRKAQVNTENVKKTKRDKDIVQNNEDKLTAYREGRDLYQKTVDAETKFSNDVSLLAGRMVAYHDDPPPTIVAPPGYEMPGGGLGIAARFTGMATPQFVARPPVSGAVFPRLAATSAMRGPPPGFPTPQVYGARFIPGIGWVLPLDAQMPVQMAGPSFGNLVPKEEVVDVEDPECVDLTKEPPATEEDMQP